jgi:hypothetical protein
MKLRRIIMKKKRGERWGERIIRNEMSEGGRGREKKNARESDVEI